MRREIVCLAFLPFLQVISVITWPCLRNRAKTIQTSGMIPDCTSVITLPWYTRGSNGLSPTKKSLITFQRVTPSVNCKTDYVHSVRKLLSVEPQLLSLTTTWISPIPESNVPPVHWYWTLAKRKENWCRCRNRTLCEFEERSTIIEFEEQSVDRDPEFIIESLEFFYSQ